MFLKNVREEVVGNYDKAGDDNHLFERYVAEAKRTETRESRVQKIIPMILEKKGLNDKYKK